MKEISVVIPSYNEEKTVGELAITIHELLDKNGISHEIIVVDDGSTDRTRDVLVDIAQKGIITYVRLRRNFGKALALQTGFNISSGKYVVTIDADMQDEPSEIINLYRKIKDEDMDIVSGWRKKRNDRVTKVIASRIFNLVVAMFGRIKLHDINCGLKIYRQEVIKSIKIYGELHRYIPLIAYIHGFRRIGEVPVVHHPRKYGKSKYGLWRYIAGFLDLLTVAFAYRFALRPMHMFGTIGIITFIVGAITTAYIIGEKLYKLHHGLPVREVVAQPLFYLSLVLLIIGVNLFLAGFISELFIRSNYERHDLNVNIMIAEIIQSERESKPPS